MEKTKVTVDFYKESGKWNYQEVYFSDFEPYQGVEITNEIKNSFNGKIFTVEVEKGKMWNKWLERL